MYKFRKNGNEINDGIDRAFVYPPYVLELIDSAEVQRTHRIIQNGFSSISYPNLLHSRKVHQIGTAKNTIRMLDFAAKNGSVSIDIGIYLPIAASAAVVHDIGHSPFSHDLEALISSFTGKTHEEIAGDIILGNFSLKEFYGDSFLDNIIGKQQRASMFDFLKNIPTIPEILNHYGISEEIVAQIINRKIADRVKGRDRIGKNHFLREIIDGKVFDADKFDYLQRDHKNAGINEFAFNPQGLTAALGLVETDNGIHMAVSDMGIDMINQMLSTKSYMYSRVYTHKTVLKVQAMVYEACKRFLNSLGEKAKDYGSHLHMLDDTQFETFVNTQSKGSSIAAHLLMTAKYDRRNKYDFAYRIENRDIPSSTTSKNSLARDTMNRLYKIKNEQGEDYIRDEILKRANAGTGTNLKDYEIIVYFPYPRKLKTKGEQLNDFQLYVFEHRNPKISYLSKDALTDKKFFDERLDHAFTTFCRHLTSNYFIVLTPKKYVDKVSKATEEYVASIMK